MAQGDYWKFWAIGLLPDVGLAWAYMKLSDGETSSFWWCLVLLWAVGGLFLIKQALTGALIFRLYGKKKIAMALEESLERLHFPPPLQDEDFESYMYLLLSSDDVPIQLRLKAQASLSWFAATQAQGFFIGLRMAGAHDLAVKKYGATC